NRVSAPSSRTFASDGVAGPLAGSIALFVFAFGKARFFRTRLKRNARATGRMKNGSFGNFVGVPATRFADSSSDRATCSTSWLGDHLPGARGTVQAGPHRSEAATSSATALRFAVRTELMSATGAST